MINIVRTVTGLVEALLLPEVKTFIKVDGPDEDDLIETMITQSREILEEYLDRSMIDSDITLYASARQSIILPLGPVDTGTGITVRTVADNTVIEYDYDYLTLEMTDTVDGTISIVYSTLANIPDGLRLGWLQVIAFLFENRGDAGSMPNFLLNNANLQPYKNKLWI